MAGTWFASILNNCQIGPVSIGHFYPEREIVALYSNTQLLRILGYYISRRVL